MYFTKPRFQNNLGLISFIRYPWSYNHFAIQISNQQLTSGLQFYILKIKVQQEARERKGDDVKVSQTCSIRLTYLSLMKNVCIVKLLKFQVLIKNGLDLQLQRSLQNHIQRDIPVFTTFAQIFKLLSSRNYYEGIFLWSSYSTILTSNTS